MLYTVRPLESIYHNRMEKEEEPEKEIEEFPIDHGVVMAYKKDDDYIVDSICSTDMANYLNPEYYPGQIYKR